jgi:hypothetical protein
MILNEDERKNKDYGLFICNKGKIYLSTKKERITLLSSSDFRYFE